MPKLRQYPMTSPITNQSNDAKTASGHGNTIRYEVIGDAGQVTAIDATRLANYENCIYTVATYR